MCGILTKPARVEQGSVTGRRHTLPGDPRATYSAEMPQLRIIQRDAYTRCLALALVVVAAVALSCSSPEVEITLLTMNDFHGALVHGGREPGTGRPWGGAVALATQVQHERQRHPQRTFLFDAGDQMQGTPESNLLFGRSSVEVLNLLGVDAAALGNHEFDWGIDTLRARLRDMRYPMLAANVFEKSSGKRPAWLQPTGIVERDGVRIGVIGLVTPETPRVTMPQNVAMLHFAAADSGVSDLALELRAAGADLVVVVCHIGGMQDADGAIDGPVAALARAVRGVDAIVAGHRHTVLAGHVDGVPVVIAASRGRALGRVTLVWDGERVVRSEVEVQRVYADSLDPSPVRRVAAYVDSVRRIVAPAVAQVVADAPRALDEETLAQLVADAMRDAVGADVAFTNIGGIRARVPSGPVTWGRLFEVVPFENTLVVAALSGRQLRAVLESRLDEARVSGLRGRIRREAAAPPRLVDAHTEAGVLNDDAVYRVVTNNFIAYGGDGFAGFRDGDDVEWTNIGVREALRSWLHRVAARSGDWDEGARRRRIVEVDAEPGSAE